MFEKGDIVEVVISHPGNGVCPALTKGNRHVVNDTDTCKSCKKTYIDIGYPILKHGHIECTCNAANRKNGNVGWYEHLFFRKIEPLYRAVEVPEQVMKELKLITEGIEQTERIDK